MVISRFKINRVRYERRKFLDWPPEIRRRLRLLTLLGGGMKVAIRNGKNPTTCVAFYNKQPIGWALICAENLFYWGKGAVMVYVKKALRRRGIGAKLMKELKRHRPKVGVSWDLTSYYFWKNNLKKRNVPKKFKVYWEDF